MYFTARLLPYFISPVLCAWLQPERLREVDNQISKGVVFVTHGVWAHLAARASPPAARVCGLALASCV